MRSKSKKGDRKRGRPTGDEGQNSDVRESIAAVAEARFAQQGFAATSIREIADEVGVNPAMVHYYFGTKAQLLQAVIDRVFQPVTVAVSHLPDSEDPVASFVDLMGKLVREHPNLPILMTREALLPGGRMRAHFLSNLAPRLGGALPPMISRAQDKGRVSRELDPAIAAVMVLSLCLFPFLTLPISSRVLGIGSDADTARKITDQIRKLLRKGMAP